MAAGIPDLSVLTESRPRRSAETSSTVVLSTTMSVPPPSTTTTVAETTTTTEPPPPEPTTTEPPETTTTTAPPPPPETTTTTAPPPPPSPPPPAVRQSDGTQQGLASWYDLPGARAGVCAHRTIVKGTVVTVTNLDTGQSITCTVDDRGPYTDDGKILDLFRDDFARLAPLEQGVIPVRLDW